MTTPAPEYDQALVSTEFRMREAGRWLKLEDGVIDSLIAPRRVLEVSIPIRRDDGTRQRFTGWRVQHNITRGPAKGGIRFHPSVNRNETVSLAAAMSLKTALMNLPLGGAKGGIAIDPKLFSPRELERVTRRYVSEIFAFLGPDKDVPAPDVGTNAQVMAWVMDQYSIGIGHAVPGVVTGKPLALGGSLGRDSATGRGVVEAASLVCQANGTSLEGKRIVIQGFGNVGMWAAQLAAGWGARIVGISDVGGVIASEKGLDIPALVLATQRGVASVVDAGVGEVIARGVERSVDVFTLPSDIAMPCALGDAIDTPQANTLAARMVIVRSERSTYTSRRRCAERPWRHHRSRYLRQCRWCHLFISRTMSKLCPPPMGRRRGQCFGCGHDAASVQTSPRVFHRKQTDLSHRSLGLGCEGTCRCTSIAWTPPLTRGREVLGKEDSYLPELGLQHGK